MSETGSQGTRAGATARARAYVESGTFETDLARRVAFKTESQLLPASLPQLRRYLEEEMTPAFAKLGFTTRIYDNPLPGQGPVLLATYIEDRRAANRTRLRPRRRHPRPGGPVDQRQGPVGHVRATATGCTVAAPPTTRVSTPSTWRRWRRCGQERGGRLGSTPSSSSRWARRRAPRVWPSWWPPTSAICGRCAGRLRRAACEARAPDDDAGLPRRHQFRPRLRPARGRASLRQLGWADRQPRVILAHALATIVGPDGRLLVPALGAPPMSKAAKECARRRGDRWRRTPGRRYRCLVGRARPLAGRARLCLQTCSDVLAFTTGTPGRPGERHPAQSARQLPAALRRRHRHDPSHASAARHLDERGFATVKVMPPPAVNDGSFAATREPSPIIPGR